MLQWIENLTYKTPPGRNIASTSRISLPKARRINFWKRIDFHNWEYPIKSHFLKMIFLLPG